MPSQTNPKVTGWHLTISWKKIHLKILALFVSQFERFGHELVVNLPVEMKSHKESQTSHIPLVQSSP